MEQFDPNIPNFLEGNVLSVAIDSPAGFPPPALANRVVDPTKAFTLTVKWNVFGALTPLWVAALGGNWNVDVYAESLGGGPEQRIGGATVSSATFSPDPAPGHVNGRIYETTITIPANTLPEGNPGSNTSGIYKLSVTVFLNSNLGTPGFDLVGFTEGPIIQAENPV